MIDTMRRCVIAAGATVEEASSLIVESGGELVRNVRPGSPNLIFVTGNVDQAIATWRHQQVHLNGHHELAVLHDDNIILSKKQKEIISHVVTQRNAQVLALAQIEDRVSDERRGISAFDQDIEIQRSQEELAEEMEGWRRFLRVESRSQRQQQQQQNVSARWEPPRHAGPEMQRQAIGERLYALIAAIYPQLAGKITGMMLEGLSIAELIVAINSPSNLDGKIKMAVEALGLRSPGCLPRHVEEILIKEAERNGECCTISFEKIQLATAAVTSCGHVFHRESIAEWLKNNAKKACPSCRQACTIRD
jgi:hypothetical protein